MPRNTKNKRLEILLSPEQYEALLREAEAEGYIVVTPGLETSGSVGEFVRDHLQATIPAFRKAAPLPGRGKYPRSAK